MTEDAFFDAFKKLSKVHGVPLDEEKLVYYWEFLGKLDHLEEAMQQACREPVKAGFLPAISRIEELAAAQPKQYTMPAQRPEPTPKEKHEARLARMHALVASGARYRTEPLWKDKPEDEKERIRRKVQVVLGERSCAEPPAFRGSMAGMTLEQVLAANGVRRKG